MKARPLIILAFIALTACGGQSPDSYAPDVPTNAPPIVSSVDPNAGAAGDEITIFGLGFTVSVPENIVIIGGSATSATSYRLLSNPTSDEVEAITAVVPDNAALGEGPIYVQVHENTSNADVSFTVTP